MTVIPTILRLIRPSQKDRTGFKWTLCPDQAQKNVFYSIEERKVIFAVGFVLLGLPILDCLFIYPKLFGHVFLI